MIDANEIQVSTYNLTALNGRHIRVATQVTYRDRVIRYTERLPKRVAIREAITELERSGY